MPAPDKTVLERLVVAARGIFDGLEGYRATPESLDELDAALDAFSNAEPDARQCTQDESHLFHGGNHYKCFSHSEGLTGLQLEKELPDLRPLYAAGRKRAQEA